MRLADGRSVAIGHPDFVTLGGRLVIVVLDENNWSVIEPLLIVSLDYTTDNLGQAQPDSVSPM